jgi:hypothetical protein
VRARKREVERLDLRLPDFTELLEPIAGLTPSPSL